MKKILIALLLMSSLLISCSSKGLPNNKKIPLLINENYIKPSDKSYEDLEYSDYSDKILVNDVVTKMNNNESFALYFYSKSCHFCHEMKPNFLRYIFETKYVFNTVEVNGEAESAPYVVQVLGKYYPEQFNTETFGVPYFYFFLEGELIAYKGITSKERQDYRLFKDFLNSYVKSASEVK